MGSTKNPEPVRTAKDNFHRQRLVRVVVEPRPKNGGFSERLKNEKSRRKIFLGGRNIWPPNTITRRRRKKKKSRGFSAWAPKNIAPKAPAEKADFWFWAPKKQKSRRKKKIGERKKIRGAEFFLGRGEKVIWPRNTITRRRRKKKKKKSAWAPKNTTLGRLRSKGLVATFFRGLREPFR